MISATLTGGVISKYENVLESSVLLAAFIPMLMDTGGNAGSQSSSLIIRNLALGTITIKDWLKVFFKELRVGVLTGIILAIVNFFRLVYFVKVDLNIAIAVCTTLIATVTVSKTIGSLLPMFAKLVKQDPAIMAAPLITTIVDTVSLVIYFSIATKLLNL
jgi:magnesium transporter